MNYLRIQYLTKDREETSKAEMYWLKDGRIAIRINDEENGPLPFVSIFQAEERERADEYFESLIEG